MASESRIESVTGITDSSQFELRSPVTLESSMVEVKYYGSIL